MRRWTGIVAASLAAGAGAAAAAPFVTAGLAEQRMRALAESDPFAHTEHIEWELTAYESGYLRARATSELTFRHPKTGEGYTLVLDHEIDHALAAGKALLRIRTAPRIPEGRPQAVVEQLFGDRAPLTVDYRMRLDGTGIARIESPATGGLRRMEQFAVEWQGLDGVVTLPADQRSLSYRLDAPGLRIQPTRGESDSLEFGAVSLEGRFEASGLDGIWVGASTAAIDHLRATGTSSEPVSVAGIQLSEEISLRQELVGARIDARVDEIVGRGERLRDLRLTLALQRIPPDLVRAFQDLARATVHARTEAERSRNSRQILARVPWATVARAEPEIALDPLEAEARSGPVKASARAGLTAPPQKLEQPLRVFDLPRYGYAEVSLQAPQAVVLDTLTEVAMVGSEDLTEADARRTATKRLDALVGQGWMQERDGGYRATASYNRGAIQINGRSLFGVGG